jgi:hypothetical protein
MPGLIIPSGVLAGRVHEIRRQVFGEQGGPRLAEALGLPDRTWRNYEAGVTIPSRSSSASSRSAGPAPIGC